MKIVGGIEPQGNPELQVTIIIKFLVVPIGHKMSAKYCIVQKQENQAKTKPYPPINRSWLHESFLPKQKKDTYFLIPFSIER